MAKRKKRPSDRQVWREDIKEASKELFKKLPIAVKKLSKKPKSSKSKAKAKPEAKPELPKEKASIKKKAIPFNDEEKESIRTYIAEFIEQLNYSKEDFSNLLYEPKKYKMIKQRNSFWKGLRELLPERKPGSINEHVRRAHDPTCGQPFDPDEEKLMLEHIRLHGTKWADIGRLLRRPQMACRDRYREIKGRTSVGRWTFEEDKLLIEAVYDCCKGKGLPMEEAVEQDIVWGMVSPRVGTRSYVQCRLRWFGKILPALKLENPQLRFWTVDDDLAMCTALYESGADAELEISWRELVANVKELGKYGEFLARNRWYYLKRSVKNWSEKTMMDCLEYILSILETYPVARRDQMSFYSFRVK